MRDNLKLSIFDLAMMSVVGIFTLRTLPLMAEYGTSAIFYYVLAALVYFIPSAFVCAELATGWPHTGGLYIWIREAFGARIGFLAIWFEWTNTVITFPATLAFIAATLAYAINPALATNKYYMLCMMLILFWGTTLLNLLGIKFSSWMSTVGLILGTLLPALLIVSLSLIWMISGQAIQIHFTWHAFWPNFSLKKSAFLIGMLLGYAGMQITAYHAQETDNPQRDFPRAIFISVLIILLISVFGSLAISTVVPQQNISVVTGLMQATKIFFDAFHLSWLLPLAAILTAIGTLAMLNMWLIGPCKGLLATARYGDLPKIAQHINRHGAPIGLLLAQAIIASILSLLYLLMPSIASSYWILVAIAAMLTLLMNILMFAALIRLKYIAADVPRAYKIPGGNVGAWIVCSIGIMVCLLAFFVGFFPPEQLRTGTLLHYELLLGGSIIVISSIPFLLRFESESD